MRKQPNKPWSATLPDGREVSGVLPDTSITRKAIQFVSKLHYDNHAVAGKTALENQLRLCLRKIGGRKVTYDQLRGARFDSYLNQKEQQLIGALLRKVTEPSPAEIEYFENSLDLDGDSSSMTWRGTILVGEELLEHADAVADFEAAGGRFELLSEELADLRRLEGADATTLEALEDEIKEAEAELAEVRHQLEDREWGVEVAGVVPDSKMTQRAFERVGKAARKNPGLSTNESQENLIRICVKEIGGATVDYGELKGGAIDEWLDTKEQNLIVLALAKFVVPDEEEVDDFLATMEIG